MLYFAYGMNCHPREMARRCPDAVYLGLARAPGFRLDFNLHCDITEDSHSEIQGTLWRITPQCLDNLDLLEGYPDYYRRRPILLWPQHSDQSLIAITYQMTEINKVLLPPGDSYRHLVAEAYELQGMNMTQLQQALERSQASRQHHVYPE